MISIRIEVLDLKPAVILEAHCKALRFAVQGEPDFVFSRIRARVDEMLAAYVELARDVREDTVVRDPIAPKEDVGP